MKASGLSVVCDPIDTSLTVHSFGGICNVFGGYSAIVGYLLLSGYSASNGMDSFGKRECQFQFGLEDMRAWWLFADGHRRTWQDFDALKRRWFLVSQDLSRSR